MRAPLRFAVCAAAVSAGASVLGVPLAVSVGEPALCWMLLGLLIMSATGIAGGAWLAARHGGPGSGFLAALGVCMLARFGLSAGGALAAAARGPEPAWSYMAGLGLGYFPLQGFEIVWFLRGARSNLEPARKRQARIDGSVG